MSFRLTEEMARFFANIDQSTIKGAQFLKMDQYHACLMLGLSVAEIAPEETNFMDPFLGSGGRYPEAFAPFDTYLQGLLVEAEIRRRDLDLKDRDLVEQETVRLLDPSAPFGLSDQGLGLMNRYAARGFELLRTGMGPPRSVEAFLVSYARLWREDGVENVPS